MPFPTTLSAGQITQVQSSPQYFKHYLLVNPNDIVWQAQVNETITSSNYAEFDWVTTLQGNRTNVRVGQLLFVTTSATDFNQAVIRGRVRVVPDATTVYLNESSKDLTTSMYVTVIDDYDIFEKLQRTDVDGNVYKDWDDTFQKLPPTISGLQSTYADVTGAATVTWSFSPTGTARASGATISTWLWEIGDGSFVGGTSSSNQNVQVQFPGAATNEHRWVHVTVTDSNGNATTFNFEVYTVNPATSTASIIDVQQINITATVQDGFNATVTPWQDFARSTVIDQTRVTLVSVDNYNGTTTPIVSNIIMVGRIRTEDNRTQADIDNGILLDASLSVEGFATKLRTLPAPQIFVEDASSPTAWGQIKALDPTRAIVHLLAFHSTALSICSIDFDDLSGYRVGEFPLQEPFMLESVNKAASYVNAIAAFAPSGEITIRRRASMLTSAGRSGLTTVYNFVKDDIGQLGLSIEYGEQVGEVIAAGDVYNTTAEEIDYAFYARAPAQGFGEGRENTQLDSQILTANATQANARAELASRAANALRLANPKWILSVTFACDGFWWLIPTLHQRYTHTLAATDTVRGIAFTTSDYWQLRELNYTLAQVFGADGVIYTTRITDAVFEEETLGANAGILVTQIANPADFEYPAIPPMPPYLSAFNDPLTYYPTDTPDTSLTIKGLSFAEPFPPGTIQEPDIGEEVLNVSMRTGVSVETTRTTVNAEIYTIRITGDGSLGAAIWSQYIDLTSTVQGGIVPASNAPQALPSATGGVFSSGNGIEDTDIVEGGNPYQGASIGWVFASDVNFTGIQFIGTLTDYRTGGGGKELRAVTYDGAIFTAYIDADGAPGAFNESWNGAFTLPTGDKIFLRTIQDRNTPNYIQSATFQGTGATNPFTGVSAGARGDAFYTGYDVGEAQLYAGLDGLIIEGAKPTNIPEFNPTHEYIFTYVGDGGTIAFEFNDSGGFTDNSNTNLVVTVTGPNMGYTP